MRPTIARLAAACALAVTFTGTALAGNPNAPGQQKKDTAAAAEPAQQDQQQATQAFPPNPSGQSNGQATAPGQVKKSVQVPAPAPAEQAAPQQTQASSRPSHAAPGEMKKTQSSSSSSSSLSAQAGVKPSSTTTHWTHCRTGGSAGAATCTAQEGTPNVGADVSKRYGNGKTAAQIAVSRGAPAGTLITGPGNSQPHKVSDCRHKSNPSGGVDVHAVKSYSTSSCVTETQHVPSTSQVSVAHVCGHDIVTTLSQSVIGVLHGHSEHLMTNTHSAHFTKHADKVAFGQTASTKVVPTTETCSSSSNSGSSTSTSNSSSNTSTSSNTSSSTSSNTSNTSNTTSNTSNTSSTSTSNTSNASTGTQSASGVLGAEKTPAKPKTSSSGGVLGSVSNVAGTSLPFTGFPLWIAALVGLGLLASGVLFWRRGTARV